MSQWLGWFGPAADCKAWLFCQLVQSPPGRARQVWLVSGAALVGLFSGLAWQWPQHHEEKAAGQQRLVQLETMLESERGKPAPPIIAPGLGLPAQGLADLAPWRWHLLALSAGLVVERGQTTPKESGAAAPAQLRLRLRGRYHQHGAWVASMANDLGAPRLQSHVLQSDGAGLHVADVVLEPWLALPELDRRPSAVTALAYRPTVHLDPMSEPARPDSTAPPSSVRAPGMQAPSAMDAAALEELSFTGTLRQGEQWVALLSWRHRVYSVRVGDELAGQTHRVLRIDEGGLWLQEAVRHDGGRGPLRERHWRVGAQP